MQFFLYLGVLLFTSFANKAIARYLQSRVKPPVPGPFQAPNIPTGTVIPVLYGTQRLPGITTWFGQAKLVSVNLNSHTLFGLFPATQTLTYQWKVTMMQLYCWGPVGQLINMVFGNVFSLADQPLTQRIVDPVTGASGTIPTFGGEPPFPVSEFGAGFGGDRIWNLILPNLYGGLGHGGGLTAVGGDVNNPYGGNLRFYSGGLGNDQDPVMAGYLGAANTPTYSDFCYHIFEDVNVGESSVPAPIDIIAYCEPKGENVPDGIGGFDVNGRDITGLAWNWPARDLSGAVILIDLLCNERYGKGEPLSVIRIGTGDSDGLSGSFEDANRALATEGLGISLVFSGNPSDVDSTIQTVLQHIDGVLRRNPVTQQRELKLVRDEAATDDDFAAIRSFDESSIQSIDNWGRPDWDDTLNWITITFSNAEKLYQQDSVTLRNHANFAMTGSWRGTQVQYLGITDKALALKIASRDLKKTTLRLWRGQVKLNRSAWDVAEGDVIKLTYAPYKLDGTVVRVLAVDRGEETNGVITLDVIQDAFGFDNILFTREVPVVPLGFPTIIKPYISAVAQDIDGVNGRATVTLVDPEHRVYEIAYRTLIGGGALSDWTVVSTATPNTGVTNFPYINPVTDTDFNGDHVFEVPLSFTGESQLEYRFSAIGYGTVASPDDANIVLDASVTFATLATPQIQWHALVQSNGEVQVEVDGLSDFSVGTNGHRIRSFDVSLDSGFTHFYNFDVTAGFIDPTDWLTPPWTTPNLGSVIDGPLNPGDTKVLYLKVHAERFNPATSTWDAIDYTDQLTISRPPAQKTQTVFTDDGDGHVIATGSCCFRNFDFDGTITGWTLLSTQAAAITFDLWRNNGGVALPTIADSLGLSFGTVTDLQVASGTLSIAIAAGDNFVLDILTNDISEYFELTLLIDKVV